jgi:hypothetical protein
MPIFDKFPYSLRSQGDNIHFRYVISHRWTYWKWVYRKYIVARGIGIQICPFPVCPFSVIPPIGDFKSSFLEISTPGVLDLEKLPGTNTKNISSARYQHKSDSYLVHLLLKLFLTCLADPE